MMKSAIIVSALAIAGIQAQGEGLGGAKGPPKGEGKGGAKGGSQGGNSGIMSALGSLFGENGVPYGPAPKGCAAHEVIIGSFFQWLTMKWISKVCASSRDLRARLVRYNCW
jgi:hypothetical protein